jgi:alkylhydroperoxidase/carboxymuconolactone decarboxylase family protein YurZ
MDDGEAPPTEALRARIEAIRQDRGFLLPHHGAMAVAMPALQDAYFAMYRELTLSERHLEPFEKEFVWLCVLIACNEAIGTHHLDLFRRHGGTESQAVTATRLTAFAIGAEAFGFVQEHWSGWFPLLQDNGPYCAGVDALLADGAVSGDLAHLAMAAVQAALGREWGVAAHIEAAYSAGVSEDKLAEALSLVMWPAGVNRFLDACAVWHDLMKEGKVTPSERFRIWAETPRQSGFQHERND